MSASIREIANQITGASDVTRTAVGETNVAEQTICQLRTEVARIGQIASLIAIALVTILGSLGGKLSTVFSEVKSALK